MRKLAASRIARLVFLAAAFGVLVPLDHLTGRADIKGYIHLVTYCVGMVGFLWALFSCVWQPSAAVSDRRRRWALRGAALFVAAAFVGLAFIEGALVGYYPIGLLVGVLFAVEGFFVGALIGFIFALFVRPYRRAGAML